MLRVSRNAGLWGSLLLSVALPIVVGSFLVALFPGWRWDHNPSHALVEGIGAFASLIIAATILTLVKSRFLSVRFIWVACALIAMGALDGVHALLHAGNSFVWTHSVATLIGGLGFAAVWLPESWLTKKNQAYLFVATGIGTLMLVGAVLFSSHDLPLMASQGEFTPLAQMLNLAGGVGFIIAAVYFSMAYMRSEESDCDGRQINSYLAFANHCVLFGVAGLLFESSMLWDASWWWWHFLRFAAYLVVLFYFLSMFKSIRETVSEQEAQVRLLLNSTAEGIYGLDTNGNTTFANKACLDLLGAKDIKGLRGQSIHSLLRRGNNEVLLRLDGGSVPIEYSSYPIIKNETVVGSVVVFSDISERRKAEQALKEANELLEERVAQRTQELEDVVAKLKQEIIIRRESEALLQEARESAEKANKAKSEFLQRMSHELRTPLNAVLGFSELLSFEPLEEDHKNSVNEISKAGDHLLSLVNELLDLARIESGNIELKVEEVNCQSVLDDCISLVSPLLETHYVALKNLSGDCCEYFVRADRTRFKQILINLLSNAIKYNKEGGRVDILIEPKAHSLRFYVNDTGLGIPADKIDNLFTAFDRLGRDYSGIQGYGIGLAITKQMVEAMGGSIGAVSEEDVGTSVWFELPLAGYSEIKSSMAG